MPTCVSKVFKRLHHIPPQKPQYALHDWNRPIYGKHVQVATPPDNLPILPPEDTKYIQAVTGTFLYYASAIDPTILPAINNIASMQSHPTKDTMKKAKRLLDYMHTYPNAKVYASMQVT